MATLARLHTFLPGDPILSGEVNGEFDQLVNALNGTSTNRNLVVRFSDAAVAPLRVDQLGAGVIQQWAQAGVVVASILNNGQFNSEVAPGTPPFVIDSTTMVPNLNADTVDGIEGANIVRKDDAVSQTIVSDLLMSKDNPVFRMHDSDGAGGDFIINRNGADTNIGRISQADLFLSNTTGVYTFGQIPVLPASNPTTANQATRKQYVDDRRTAWSASGFVIDPSIAPVAPVAIDMPIVICPDGVGFLITKIHVAYYKGSHTSGANVTFAWQRRTAAASWLDPTVIGTASLNDTNNAQFVPHTNDIADATFLPGDTLELFITARSGTITERNVSIMLFGTQKVF